MKDFSRDSHVIVMGYSNSPVAGCMHVAILGQHIHIMFQKPCYNVNYHMNVTTSVICMHRD